MAYRSDLSTDMLYLCPYGRHWRIPELIRNPGFPGLTMARPGRSTLVRIALIHVFLIIRYNLDTK